MDVAPTIAVIPFDNPSNDPEQAYFARGFVEELITELSRFPTIEIIHAHTSYAPGELHGVRYFLHGSVHRRAHVQRPGSDWGWRLLARSTD